MADITLLNTASDLLSKTLLTKENAYTITGLHTFDRDPSAPFAVSASSAVVPNLDADKLDGIEAAAMAQLAVANVFTESQTISAAIAKVFTSYKVSGTQKGIVGLAGAIKGNSEDALMLFSETASGLEFAVNGSTTPVVKITDNGLIGTVTSHAGGNNCNVGTALVVNFTGVPTGIAGGVAGRILFCLNNTGGDIILSEEDAASSAANRFAAAAGAANNWVDNSLMILVYNGTDSRWAAGPGFSV